MQNKKFKRHTVTSALPYANGPIHIGHLAGVYVPADIYVRFLRSKGEDVIFVCGSDEHGVPITIRARKEGKTPQEVADTYNELNKKSFKDFGISFNIYSRTSNKIHHQTASDFFVALNDKSFFKKIESEQYFDEEQNEFLADRYIKGTCPKCGHGDAYGDQCENCGSTLSPAELIDPKSMLSGSKPVLKKTKHWYLPLDEYEPWLRKWILNDHKEWKSNVYGQCKSWIDQGLQARAVTRDLDWGIPVPVEGAEGKVLYVWFDAPIGYISATKEWAEKNNRDWEPYWKDDRTRLLHFIGKDNIVFHCIIFPCMLKEHGDFILPENVPANEFLNLENNKISTSRNWAVWLHEYLNEFPGKEDVLRYTLCANAPETKDNDFTWKDFQAKNNNELVAILGNFINRVIVLINKYYDGKIPERNELFDIDDELINGLKSAPGALEKSLNAFRFREALSGFMEIARSGNKYLADAEPWKLIKTSPGRVATIMNLAVQVVANIAILGAPFLPFTSEKIFRLLNLGKLNWGQAGEADILGPGHLIRKPELLFSKIEDREIQFQIDKLKATEQDNSHAKEQPEIPEAKDEIAYEDFSKIDVRIGKVLKAEKVEKSSKLLKMSVDTGIDKRTIVSGIAKYFKPEEVEGKQVSVLVNLAPRKIMGIESQGMILLAEDQDGRLVFVTPEHHVVNGSVIS
ncbi:MAG: methionine--tRNA ligase [Cytophagales bacterium]|nr:methionine--tRNA ligase [Cytophagales bacterium]